VVVFGEGGNEIVVQLASKGLVSWKDWFDWASSLLADDFGIYLL